VACAPQPQLASGSALLLTKFSENGAEVAISLQRASDDQVSLAATFTPLETGFHVYSKDLPRNGVYGQGRPTLLELTSLSKMRALGGLSESVAAVVPGYLPTNAILIYPTGPVTLMLPIELPSGRGWVEDEVSVTFMVCSAATCKPPVIGKIIPVRVPGAEVLSTQ